MSVKEFLQMYRERWQKYVHALLLLLLAVVWVARACGINATLNPDQTQGLTLAVIAFLLWDIAQNTYQLQRTKVFSNQDDMYSELQNTLKNKPSEAVFIQYSGAKCDSIVACLLRKGVTVTLYVKDPDYADSCFQKERIEASLKSLSSERYAWVKEGGKLIIKKYKSPASFRAILIDRDILCVGWYTYYQSITTEQNASENEHLVHGHNAPGLICHYGSDEFRHLIKEFDQLKGNYDNFSEERT